MRCEFLQQRIYIQRFYTNEYYFIILYELFLILGDMDAAETFF